MKIYRLNTASGDKYSGVKGDSYQSSNMAGDYEYDAFNSFRNFYTNDVDPRIIPVLLEKKATVTDLISIAILNPRVGIIISETFLKHLQKFRIMKHKLYPIPLTYTIDNRELLHDHTLLTLEKGNHELIDFKSSQFLVKSILESINEPIEINSEVEFLRLDKEFVNNSSSMQNDGWHKYIGYTKLVLHENLKYDLFRLGRFGGMYMSESLKNSLEEICYTGVEFEEEINIYCKD